MAIRNGLNQDRILGNLVPVDLRQEVRRRFSSGAVAGLFGETHIFEVLLLENGKEKAGHGIIGVGSHLAG